MTNIRELAPIDLGKEFRHQAKHPPGGEQVTGAFWEAMLEASLYGPIADNLEEVATARAIINPDATAPYIAGIIRTAYRAYLEESDKDFDIQRLTTKASWREPLGRIATALSDVEQGRGDQFADNLHANLWTRQVQTNIPERYTAAELLLQVARERFQGGVNALDIGSGIMLGPLAMMDARARERLRFSQVINPPQHFRAPDRRHPLEKTNILLERPSILNSYACVDLAAVYNESSQSYDNGIIPWSKASRRPSEARDTLIDELTGSKPSNIRFDRANLADAEDFVKYKAQLGDKKFRFISWITTAHQMKPDERAAMFYHIKSILSPDGIVYIEDFATLERRRKLQVPGITDIHMLQQWHRPGSFRGFIYDNAAPSKRRGMEHVFTFDDSRCDKLTLGLAHIAINGELVPIHEAIRLAA